MKLLLKQSNNNSNNNDEDDDDNNDVDAKEQKNMSFTSRESAAKGSKIEIACIQLEMCWLFSFSIPYMNNWFRFLRTFFE